MTDVSSFSLPHRFRLGVSVWLMALCTFPAHAQLQVVTRVPARNALTAPRAASVALTFDQPVNPATAGNVRVFSSQRGGQLVRGGNAAVTGNTLTVDPATDFSPGETVFVTVPPTVQSGGGQGAAPHVYQFTAAVNGPGNGLFVEPIAFSPEVNTNNSPKTTAVGDIDGDGDLDMLVTTNFDVHVHLNSGSGDFTRSQSVSIIGPFQVVLADVDSDGDLDFLTANSSSASLPGTVSVRLNDGTGTFSGTHEASIGTGALNIALGDVDGDGDLDFVTANVDSSPGTASIRFNDGTGFFSGAQEVLVGGSPQNVVLGDVDADNDMDLLCANYTSSSVSVLINNGRGIFSGPTNVNVGPLPFKVTLEDIDNDGDLDMLTTNTQPATVNVRLNDGSGNFSGTTSLTVDPDPRDLMLGDGDSDGDLDLFIAHSSLRKVSMWRNDGAGTFSWGLDTRVGAGPYDLSLGDLDADGDLDLLVTNRASTTVSIRLNGGTGPTGLAPDAAAAALGIYPNPATTGTAVQLTGLRTAHLLTLLDALGRPVAQLRPDASGEAALLPAALVPGLYVVRTTDGRTARLVVE